MIHSVLDKKYLSTKEHPKEQHVLHFSGSGVQVSGNWHSEKSHLSCLTVLSGVWCPCPSNDLIKQGWRCSNNVVMNVAPGPPVRLTSHVFLLCHSFAAQENDHKHICMGEVVISNMWLTFGKDWFKPKPWSFSKPNIIALLPKPHQTVREQWTFKKTNNLNIRNQQLVPYRTPSPFPLCLLLSYVEVVTF